MSRVRTRKEGSKVNVSEAALYSGCSKHVPPIIDWSKKARGLGKDDLSLSDEPCGEPSLSPAVLSKQGFSLLTLYREGLGQ